MLKKYLTHKISANTYFILFSIFVLSCSETNESKKEIAQEKGKEEITVKTDSAAPLNDKNWIDVQSAISKMDSTTNYNQIVDLLGKPYEEYSSPSLKEEYVLFYDVPGVNGAFFWIMLNTETKTFLYWSGEKNEK